MITQKKYRSTVRLQDLIIANGSVAVRFIADSIIPTTQSVAHKKARKNRVYVKDAYKPLSTSPTLSVPAPKHAGGLTIQVSRSSFFILLTTAAAVVLLFFANILSIAIDDESLFESFSTSTSSSSGGSFDYSKLASQAEDQAPSIDALLRLNILQHITFEQKTVFTEHMDFGPTYEQFETPANGLSKDIETFNFVKRAQEQGLRVFGARVSIESKVQYVPLPDINQMDISEYTKYIENQASYVSTQVEKFLKGK